MSGFPQVLKHQTLYTSQKQKHFCTSSRGKGMLQGKKRKESSHLLPKKRKENQSFTSQKKTKTLIIHNNIRSKKNISFKEDLENIGFFQKNPWDS